MIASPLEAASLVEYHPQVWVRDEYTISTDSKAIPLQSLNAALGSKQVYWARALPEHALRELVDHSLCFGLYHSPKPRTSSLLSSSSISDSDSPDVILVEAAPMVSTLSSATLDDPSSPDSNHDLIGFARLVTDRVSITYLTDVYVLPEHQGKGLAKWLITCIQEVIESMPYLRGSMLIIGHGDQNLQKMYSKLMHVERMDPDYEVWHAEGPGYER